MLGTLSSANVEEMTGVWDFTFDCSGVGARYPGVWYKFHGADQQVRTLWQGTNASLQTQSLFF